MATYLSQRGGMESFTAGGLEISLKWQYGVSILTEQKVFWYEVLDYFGIHRLFDMTSKSLIQLQPAPNHT